MDSGLLDEIASIRSSSLTLSKVTGLGMIRSVVRFLHLKTKFKREDFIRLKKLVFLENYYDLEDGL